MKILLKNAVFRILTERANSVKTIALLKLSSAVSASLQGSFPVAAAVALLFTRRGVGDEYCIAQFNKYWQSGADELKRKKCTITFIILLLNTKAIYCEMYNIVRPYTRNGLVNNMKSAENLKIFRNMLEMRESLNCKCGVCTDVY